MKAVDCRDHQAKIDLKRETPINGRATEEATETTLRTLRVAGNRDPAATTHRAIPNTKRIADAPHRPLLDCQFDMNLTIAAGEVNPKTPIPAANSETAMTIDSLTKLCKIVFTFYFYSAMQMA